MPDSDRPLGPKKAVHIDADEVHVESAVELPAGHVIVEPPTAATPAMARPSTDVRAAEEAVETAEALSEKGRREETILRTEGQRKTSWRWEGTQMWLALIGVGGFMLVHCIVVVGITYILVNEWRVLSQYPAALTPLVVILTAALGSIASLASSVASTYFTRTNSHKIGGVQKDYEGR